jgi:hypothetical protein
LLRVSGGFERLMHDMASRVCTSDRDGNRR